MFHHAIIGSPDPLRASYPHPSRDTGAARRVARPGDGDGKAPVVSNDNWRLILLVAIVLDFLVTVFGLVRVFLNVHREYRDAVTVTARHSRTGRVAHLSARWVG